MACDKNPSTAITDTKRMGSSKPAWTIEMAALKTTTKQNKNLRTHKKGPTFQANLRN